MTPHPTPRVAQLGDLRSSSARQAQLLLQQDKHEVGSECGPGTGGAPLQDPHSCQPHPHTWQQSHVTPGCHCRIQPPTVPRVRVTNHPPLASTRGHLPVSPGLVVPWPGPGGMAQGQCSGSSCSMAPGQWLHPVPTLSPPTPGVGSSQQPLHYLFFQPLGIFLVRSVCSQVVQQAKGRLGTGTQASAILLVCWAPSSSSTALMPTCVPPVTPHSVTDSSSTL